MDRLSRWTWRRSAPEILSRLLSGASTIQYPEPGLPRAMLAITNVQPIEEYDRRFLVNCSGKHNAKLGPRAFPLTSESFSRPQGMGQKKPNRSWVQVCEIAGLIKAEPHVPAVPSETTQVSGDIGSHAARNPEMAIVRSSAVGKPQQRKEAAKGVFGSSAEVGPRTLES